MPEYRRTNRDPHILPNIRWFSSQRSNPGSLLDACCCEASPCQVFRLVIASDRRGELAGALGGVLIASAFNSAHESALLLFAECLSDDLEVDFLSLPLNSALERLVLSVDFIQIEVSDEFLNLRSIGGRELHALRVRRLDIELLWEKRRSHFKNERPFSLSFLKEASHKCVQPLRVNLDRPHFLVKD